MKAISGVLWGYALILAFVGTAFARGSDANASGGASSNTHPEGTVDVGDVTTLQGQAESSTNIETGENAGASLDAIRDRARSASTKALYKVERRLTEVSRQIDAEANQKGDILVAGRVAPEFGMTRDAMMSEQARLETGLGELVIAHTLAANTKKEVTTQQIFMLQREGFTWGQIAHGLNLRVDEVATAVTSEGHVAVGRAQADGKPAMIRSATRASTNTNAGTHAGRASVGTSSSAGVGLNLGK
jgi:hypothetical protein